MKKHILFLCTILTHSTSVKAEVPHAEKILPLRIQNPPIPFPSPPSVTVYGYHAYWTGDPMDIDLSPLSHIAIFNVDLNADGTLSDTQRWTSVAPDIVEKAHGMGVKVHLCLTSFYDSINNTVLPDASKRATAISELANLVNAYGADGVNIDIEGMDEEQRDNLNLFVQELRPHVDEIFLATPAVDWTDAYDYETLAANSDGLFIMGYGYHWKGGDPGPVDPLFGGSPWSVYSLAWTVEDYRDKGVPDNKIILGLPLYGREWPTENNDVPGTATEDGVAVVMSTAIDRAAQEGSLYDATTYTPYILETNSQLWYGDVDSVQERIRWSVSEGLQGIGFWALQYENGVDGFWEMVQSETVLSIDPEEPEDTEDTGSPQDGENQAPTADAGDDFTSVLGEDFTLDGSASSDPEAVPLTYRWEQLHGPEASIQFPNQSQTTVSVRDEGTYVFKLHVSNGALSDTDQVLAVVQSAPKGGCNTSNSPTWLFMIGLLSLFRRKNTLREI